MRAAECQEKSNGCGPLLRTARESQRPLRQEVFDFVRASGHAARAEITANLDISAGTVTTLTADLIAAGYLREVERVARESGRGRPRVALEVVQEAAYVVGIKLAAHRHTAVLVDLAGNVVADVAHVPDDSVRSLEQLLTDAETLVNALLKSSGHPRQKVQAVGVGMPGIIDHRTGIVAWSPLFAQRNVHIAATLAAKLGCPVVVDNDVNVLTLAELWFGEGRTRTDFAVVTIESGVGMGLVVGNELYRGPNGMALELGHTKVQMDGALCQCGQRGCLEAYLADYALTREAITALSGEFDKPQPTEDVLNALYRLAMEGHPGAETIFRRAGRFLSLGLANVVQLFDPTLIILSGARAQYEHFYTDEVLDEMRKMTLNDGRQRCPVVINAWDDLVWARGASALALAEATAILIGGEVRAA